MLPRGSLEMLNGRRKWRKKTGNDAGNRIFMIEARYSSLAWAFLISIERERFYIVGMLPICALEMLNGRRKWRKKTGNDANKGIFMIKARSSSHAVLLNGKGLQVGLVQRWFRNA